MTISKSDANKQISAKLAEINKLFNEATAIADEAQVEFSFNGPPGRDWGMSGWYVPAHPTPEKVRGCSHPETKTKFCAECGEPMFVEWDSSSEDEPGWKTSSDNC